MLSLVLSCLLLIWNPAPSIALDTSGVEHLLPNSSIPHHYDLRLNVQLGPKYTYNGTVDIDITVLKKVQQLVLHSHDLKINVKQSFLSKDNGLTSLDVISAKENPKNRFLTLAFNKEIVPGNYMLRIVFAGNYYTYANGFFLSAYNDSNGVEKYMLATHFEPVGARDMFPCYDEPNLKTTFKVEITHPKEFHAVSNMPAKSIRSQPTTKTTTFKTTPEMSTYLLALGVSEYETLEANYGGKTYAIHVQPGKLNQVKFSLNTTLESIRQYENLLQVNYSLPKLDGIVVPTFGGGMENWGLIVYGSSIVLPYTGTIPSQVLRGVVNLITHEVAHQWFGNLVTLDWWDYVWLNEGFATYYAQRISDLIYPKERFMDRHMLKLLRVLKSENLEHNAEAINRPVTEPESIRPKFNSISYDKGSAIVRFMQMTFPGYDQGISDYLKANSYNNSEPLDLFKSLNDRANLRDNLTIQNIMNGWGSNPGYPLLTVNSTRKGNFSNVIFTQQRFSVEGLYSSEQWWIPITFTTEAKLNFNNLTVQNWLSDQQRSSALEIETNNGWLIANLQKAAYMRVNYDLDNWNRIIAYLKGPYYKKIHHLNRIQLIDDSRNLAAAKLIPESISLDLLSYVKQEQDPLVLAAAEISFKEYTEYLRGTEIFPKFEIFVGDILGWERAADVLKIPNLKAMAEKAALNYESRNHGISTVFDEIVERLHTPEAFMEVQRALIKCRTLNSKQQLKFIENISNKFEQNKILKDRFLKYNYEEVKNWLNTKY